PTPALTTGQVPNPRDVEGIQAAQVARATDFGLALNLKSKFEGLEVQRYESVDGKPAIAVSGRRGSIVSETLFFDRESGLLVRRAILTKTAYGSLAEQV